MKRIVMFFFLLLLLPFSLSAGVKIIEQNAQRVVLEFTLDSLQIHQLTLAGKNYLYLDFEGADFPEQVGEPALPFWQSRLAVPASATVHYSVNIGTSELLKDVDVVPQFVIPREPGSMDQVPLAETYRQAGPIPLQMVEVSEPYRHRRLNVVRIRLFPFQYFPLQHQLRIFRRFRVIFTFDGAKATPLPARLPDQEKQALPSVVLNWQSAPSFAGVRKPALRRAAVTYDFNVGQWYKFPIREEGVYQLTGSDLKSAGIDIQSVQLATVQLFNYGGAPLPPDTRDPRPEDLNEIAVKVVDVKNNGILDEDDRIIFYARGPRGWDFDPEQGRWEFYLNYFDDNNYFLLTFNQRQGKRIQEVPSPADPNPLIPTYFTDYFHFEEDHYNVLSSGPDWYWLKFRGLQDAKNVEFQLPTHLVDGPMLYTFFFKGGSGSKYGDNDSYQYRLSATLNQQPIFQNFLLTRSDTSLLRVPYDQLVGVRGGRNELNIVHQGNLNGCEVYLDYFEIQLNRAFVAENNLLHFRYLLTANQPYQFEVSGFPGSGNTVWEITDFAEVKEIQPLQDGSTVTFQARAQTEQPVEYLVFNPAAVRSVEGGIESIPNHANLRDPSRKGQFIIITPDEFYEAAAFLEDWRETQVPNRLETERVKLSEIFLEFSSGVRDITAIRDFLKYAYENWSMPPEYVLLFGDGHYDYRHILFKDYPNLIPPFEIFANGEVYSRESDNYYVAFGYTDGGGRNVNYSNLDPDLPIGRLPFNNLQEIEIYRDKAEIYSRAYLLNPQTNGWQTWITLVADDQYGPPGFNNEWYHLQPTEDVNKLYIPDKFNRAKIYLHDYERVAGGLGRVKPKATEDLLDQINRGTLVINYFGHGNPDTWAHESVLTRSRDLQRINNEDRLALWVAATCDWGKYDDPAFNSMSEEMIWLPHRGGIAVISSSRPVYVFGNVQFAKSFYDHLFNHRSEVKPSIKLGDAFIRAMRGSPNYQKYHLFGDPTQRLADPQYVVKIESITPDTLKALSRVRVIARVVDEYGNPITNFNGKALIQVFDAREERYQPEANVRYTYNGGTVFKGLVSLKNGRLEGEFIVPKSIKYQNTPTGRISIYAWSESGGGDAVGFRDNLLLYGTEKELNDQQGPAISVAFKEVPTFFDGDYVGNQPTLIMEISDESGINLTREVGHRIELTIDGTVKKDLTEYFVYDTDSYTQGTLEYTLPALSNGSHELKITCWDNLNNFSEKIVTIRTSEGEELLVTEVVNFPNPTNGPTDFTFQMVSPLGEAEVVISIYTVTGRKIRELRDTAFNGFNRIHWDGLDRDGDIIANGVYLYKLVVRDGNSEVKKIEKLAIVR